MIFICYKLKSRLDQKNNELNILRDKAETQSQRGQEYISSLSQELRTPLYGIMGLTNLLVEEHPEISDNKNLKSLKFSGDYLLTLINNVLQVNYITSKEIIPHKTIFDLKEVTQYIVNSFSYATENSGNTLHFDFDDSIDQSVKGDSSILSQILMNLISNSLRFTKNGNIFFSVNLSKRSALTNTISFTVKHDGNEVSKEEEKSIYQEFINIEKVKKTYLGTGLNATIVNRLAKAVGGKIILQSKEYAGSEYSFIVDLENTNVKEDKQGHTSSVNDKQKVLIVDDNKLNLLVADKILSNENFDCTTIDNGFDAIDLAREHDYDIILMDINMPKLNGIGTTKRIREFNENVPVIALTAVDVTQLNRQIMQAGLNDYILKPYDKNLLLDMIHKYIKK
ncbi:hypothetical protein GCM10022393_38930 [Aquimarina addita]|uniref:histidine kinase n=1 Tax=Aquimarina addita TaxID=870485 RepID=A0ABP6UVW7_9FLAO